MHDLVLVGADAQRGVLVRDPREQALRQRAPGSGPGAGEGGDRAGQRLLLRALGLVAAVEHAVEQLRVGGEQVPVEALGDLADVLADHRQRRLDDRTVLIESMPPPGRPQTPGP